MLEELRVRDLGVIADLGLVLGDGMTVITGETGAGKTLVVEAIELLVGGRADPVLVRPGGTEAVVEGRFAPGADGDETILGRTIPAGSGRSRAYVDGRMATAAALADAGAALVDLHGQHAHQRLLAPGHQRAALDAYAGIDLGPLTEARRRVQEIGHALDALGGDARARAREIDLLRFQVAELEAAAVTGADEDDALSAEEDVLADATAHREAASAAHELLAGEGESSVADAVGSAIAAVAHRPPLAALDARLRALAADLADIAAELRAAAERLEDDPERLAAIRERRQLLRDLTRKYGDDLAAVLSFATEASGRLAELESYEERAAALEAERAAALARVAAEEAKVGKARRKAAPELGKEISAHLSALAMPKARVEIAVGDADPGDEVTFLLAANPGEPALPLAKVASGGELARTMLAARLVLTSGPATLVFDEVDAGIGGEAAQAVGAALADLARRGHQVLVVTHLAQVAAHADHHVVVAKEEVGGRTVSHARPLATAAERVVELSRMLSGSPGSKAARRHAEELLVSAKGA